MNNIENIKTLLSKINSIYAKVKQVDEEKRNVVNTSMYSTFLGYGLKKYAYILLFWQNYLIRMEIMAWEMLSLVSFYNWL